MSVAIETAIGGQNAFARLREDTYDVVLVQHAPPELDAVELVEAHRLSGADDPLVVLGRRAENLLAPLCYEVGADAYLRCGAATARQLLWTIARAIEWHATKRESTRLIELDRKRVRLEHSEAERLLEQQRMLVSGLEELSPSNNSNDAGGLSACPTADVDSTLDVPASLVAGYHDLLRAHVIMGAGSQTSETALLVDSLAALGMSASRLMQLHVHVLEEMLRGLGGRSGRHVMARADLLVLELMAQLVERYRAWTTNGTVIATSPELPAVDIPRSSPDGDDRAQPGVASRV
jgi:CheY-like chemotaxis protein